MWSFDIVDFLARILGVSFVTQSLSQPNKITFVINVQMTEAQKTF